MSIQETTGTVLSYVAAFLVMIFDYLQDVSWMSIGAAVLLGARLIIDVPPAYTSISKWLRKRKRLRVKRNR
jgi:hypothetical protein